MIQPQPHSQKRHNVIFKKLTFAFIMTLSLSVPLVSAAPPADKNNNGGNTNTLILPPASVLAVADSASTIQLQWLDTNSSELGYKIERQIEGGQFVEVVTTSANVTSFTDQGLMSGTTYQYRLQALAKPAKNSSDYSSVVSATTQGLDTEAPVVALINPADGTDFEVAQTVNVSANASDNIGVSKVEFIKDGLLVFTDTSAPYGYVWEVDEANNGVHSLKAKAYDETNNVSETDTFQVTVNIDVTPPTVSITSPADGATYTSGQTISIDVSTFDDVGVTKVEFYRDGVLVNSDNSAPYSQDWSFDVSNNGSHNWQAVAFDAAGNQSSTALLNVHVDIAAVSNPDPSDRMIDDFAFLGPNGLKQKGRMAELNGLKGLIYADASYNKQLYLWDKQGNESWIYLPGIDDDILFNAEYVLTAADELWIFSSNGTAAFGGSGAPAVARRYQLIGSGALPTTAELMETHTFGDQNSAAGSFIRLQSGGLVGVWYNLNTNPISPDDNWADLGFAYRSPDGVWSTLEGIRVDALTNHYHRVALAQHPVDGSIWAFSKGDSFSNIEVIHLNESANGLVMDWFEHAFISHDDGFDGPEGELPALLTAVDAVNGKLLLAYQNEDAQFFSVTPFIKGARVSIAQIGVDGSRNFINFPSYVERVYGLNGLVLDQQGGMTIAYRPVNEQAQDYYDVYTSRYINGAWESEQFLGTTFTGPFPDGKATVVYSKTSKDFAVSIENYELHLLTE